MACPIFLRTVLTRMICFKVTMKEWKTIEKEHLYKLHDKIKEICKAIWAK